MVAASQPGAAGSDDRRRAQAEAAVMLVRETHTAPEDLERWLAADAANAPAYADTLVMWKDLGQAIAQAETADRSAPAASVPATRPARRLAGVAAFAAFALLFVASVFWATRPVSFDTAVGEQRIVVLKDGTRVTLNTDTELAIDDSERQRRVTLRRGEALFEVAHDPAHPFVVSAHGSLVQALGTNFVVRNAPGRLDVVLLTGSVRIDAVDRSHPPALLVPGDRFSQGKDGAVLRDRPKIETVTAWRNGELVLDNTPLSEAVAEMNRYSERPIVLTSPRASQLQLSGVFRTRDSETFAGTVGAIYGLPVTEDSKAIAIGGGHSR